VASEVLVALALAVRCRAILTEFWLDEIWSYEEFARRAHSVLDIFLNPAFRHDNNQHLNTVFLYLMGDRTWWPIYRMPALFAGLAAVAVATHIGFRRSAATGWLAGLFTAVSFIEVVYSTEARGYAWLVLFVLLAFQSLRNYLDSPSWSRAAWFWIWIVLALSAHTTVAHFYLGALLWSGFHLRGRLKDMVRLHAVPLLWALAWTLIVLRGSRVGGGPVWTWRVIGDQSFAWTFGYPVGLVPAILVAGLVLALVAWESHQLWSEGSDEGLFYVGVICGPPIFVAALAPPWLFPRYFLVSLTFVLLLLAQSIARLWGTRRWRLVAAIFVAAFIGGNLTHVVHLGVRGRGHAAEALQDIAKSSPAPAIQITGRPIDLWTTLPLAFWDRVLGLNGRLHYIRRDDPEAASADWLIVQSQRDDQPAASINLSSTGSFVLKKTYPAYGPSGMIWSIYQRAPSGPR
jgi:hypothetical protein